MKQNITITAYLNLNEGGCNYSKHFKEQWIDNNKLHPFAKQISVTTIKTSFKPKVHLKVNGNIVWDKTGNQIDPAALQEFILTKYNKQ